MGSRRVCLFVCVRRTVGHEFMTGSKGPDINEGKEKKNRKKLSYDFSPPGSVAGESCRAKEETGELLDLRPVSQRRPMDQVEGTKPQIDLQRPKKNF